ncbi:MAG: hypothetical protein GWN86_07410 [Desulfobacterales bacterium]|nr:hypothetical protein [Desulfobacterales bacterium]
MISRKKFRLTQNQSLKNPPNPPSLSGIKTKIGFIWVMSDHQHGVGSQMRRGDKYGDLSLPDHNAGQRSPYLGECGGLNKKLLIMYWKGQKLIERYKFVGKI